MAYNFSAWIGEGGGAEYIRILITCYSVIFHHYQTNCDNSYKEIDAMILHMPSHMNICAARKHIAFS
jgi:hypothetical protein